MTRASRPHGPIHPLHAVLLASSLPLFLGGLLSDWAYWRSFEVQWVNFAAWLIAGALIFAGCALLWALVGFFRRDRVRLRSRLIYVLALGAAFVVGFVNALVHAKDAWAVMPTGLILSALASLLALAAVWLGFSTLRGSAER